MYPFSVLISVYSKENPQFFIESLNSILLQTLSPEEVVIVKDGKLTPELEAVISFFQTKLPIKILPKDKNEGLGKALRDGLLFCSHEIVARMDSDDISFETRFEKQINFLINNPEYDLVGSNIEEFNGFPGDLGIIKRVPEKHEEILKYSKKRSPFNHPSVTFRKSAILKAGSYKSMILFEDYYLWLRLIKSGNKFYNFQEPLLYFRVGNNMFNRRRGYKYAKLEYRFLKVAYKENLISRFDFFRSVIIRFPLRLLPLSLLKPLYFKILRK
ncbi:glycosyltransferase [Fontibacter flavus]|uniref:Glycosyltransferase n=1 Tax=Fontibacter flavus TaxID=654838 RepID=A0ABV6FWT3_9BACT